MAQSTKWAAGIGLILVCLGLGGAAIWQQRHPTVSAIASLTEALPSSPTPRAADPSSSSTAPPAADTPPTIPHAVAPQATAPQAITPTVSQAAPSEAPHFDVVRVEPKGDTVVAGKGEPNAKVALMASGKVVAEAKADSSGQFVLLPPPLPPGDYALTLRQSPDGKSDSTSSQSVTVSVPKTPGSEVVVALAEPGKPTKLLSVPGAPPAAAAPVAPTASARPVAAAPARKLSIGAVDLENGTGFHASGTAAPGTSVHVYLNDAHLADVTANTDGSWSVTIRKGLAGGHYTVRADAAGTGAGVTARAEVPFDVPVAMAALPPATIVSPGDSRAVTAKPVAPVNEAAAETVESGPAKSEPGKTGATVEAPKAGAPTPDASSAVIEQVVTHQVSNGDNLWTISRRSFGDGRRFTQIYEANASQIRDPDLIYPGQIFVLPTKR